MPSPLLPTAWLLLLGPLGPLAPPPMWFLWYSMGEVSAAVRHTQNAREGERKREKERGKKIEVADKVEDEKEEEEV